MATFTHVVPIGANCRLTENVRRHFDHAESYPFDWWILPLPGLLALLRSGLDVERLYDPRDLERLTRPDGSHRCVRNRALDIRFVHEFPAMPASIAAPVEWSEHLDKPKARLRHLSGKLLGLNAPGNALLFVRLCIGSAAETAPDTDEGLRALREALVAMFDRASVELLAISPSGRVGSYATLPIRDRSQDWKGDFGLWSAALASTGHRLHNPGLRRFVPRPVDSDVEDAPPSPDEGGRAGRSGWIRNLLRPMALRPR